MGEKTVYILGAGFSKIAGAPLIDEFLQEAKNIYANKREQLSEEEFHYFKTVFDYQEKLSSVRTRVNFDIDNIEDFFSIIDMESIYNKNTQLKKIKKSLIYLIIKTLELNIKNVATPSFVNLVQDAYRKFFVNIDNSNSLITFNYDLLIERSLENLGKNYDYAIDATIPQENAIKVLKLHGSANWLICSNSNCGTIETLSMKALGDLYHKLCSKCNQPMIPLIVPPTWNKRLDSSKLVNVWVNAFEKLKNAQKIKIIGYSLPKTDLYFRNFLSLALKNNMSLKKIYVFDPNSIIGERYKKYFEENFARRYFEFNNIGFNGEEVTRIRNS